MTKIIIGVTILVMVSCSVSDVPMIERATVEVPTAVAGRLTKQDDCYRLEMTNRSPVIVWVKGTRFGRDDAGEFVVDIDSQKRHVGEVVGLSGGPIPAERIARHPRLASYVNGCGSDAVTGLRFTGE